jgi:formylglycine-generating enzyme required for sulfatase activity
MCAQGLKSLPLAAALAFFHPGFSQELKTYDQPIPGTAHVLKMVAVPAGAFTRGSAKEPDERPVKKIYVDAFWMADAEVTFAQWDAFFKNQQLPQSKNIDGITRPTPQYIDLTWGMGRDGKQPANSMSQQAAIMYCQWLYSKTGIFFRLPTEAEWEYACKTGKADEAAADPKKLNDIAWFADNSQAKFQPVRTKQPNALGLYDMLGNLSEWTLDQYDPAFYASAPDKNPLNPPAARYPKVVRGGSFMDAATELRCANRIASKAEWNQRDPQVPKSRWWLTDGRFVGFRVVRPAAQPPAPDIEKFYQAYLK